MSWIPRKTLLPCIGLMLAVSTSHAEIAFEEVSQQAGISHKGTTWGASWGDLDGDGWPDIWVSDHNSRPSLYLNRRDGTFSELAGALWSGDPRDDTHGAAWADFDNDGDQDLVEVVDAREEPDGTFCVGCGLNHLFVNEDGHLVDQAHEHGLDHDGQARMPLWLDADSDGRLDLLVVNTATRRYPGSILYHQGNGGRFSAANGAFGLVDGRWGRVEKAGYLVDNLLHLRNPPLPALAAHRNLESAQLADLSGDGSPELILFANPTRIYSIGGRPFSDLTHTLEIPSVDEISDAAIADFDGDGRLDMYLARGEYLPSDVVRVDSGTIKGTLTGRSTRGAPKALEFRSHGALEVSIYPTWLPLSKIVIGSQGRHPGARTFRLSADDPAVHGAPPPDAADGSRVILYFDPDRGTWILRNRVIYQYVDFIVRSPTPITEIQTVGFDRFQPRGVDVLLLRTDRGFRRAALDGEAGQDSACFFTVAGDFDNDMDEDLYMVCTGPVTNLPNRLLENDGEGHFSLVPDAGGAAGSTLGRGDTVITADYDRDGFLDLFVTNGTDPTSPFGAEGPHQLFHNRGNANHWVEIDLEGSRSNHDGIGAVVKLWAGGQMQIRGQSGGMHRMSQNHDRLHFGLGPNPRIDLLKVHWPSGRVQELRALKADQVLHIREPS